MITDDELRQIMPNCAQAKRQLFIPPLMAAMQEFGITTHLREAAFLAQLAHESGEFRWMEEIWGPTSAQRRYEPPSDLARRLGNTQAGDGKRFKGRGPIQLTGRDNYRRFGDLLGVDLVNNPEQAATPGVAFRIAALFWKSKGLNELADAQNFREITRRINGGFNGLEDRIKYYDRAKRVLNEDTMRDMPVLTGTMEVPPNLSRGILPGELEAEGGTDSDGIRQTAASKKSAKKGGGAKKGGAKKGTSKKSAAKRATAARPAAAGTRTGGDTRMRSAGRKSAAKRSADKMKSASRKASSGKGAAKRSGGGGAKKGAAKRSGSSSGVTQKGTAKRGGAAKKGGASRGAAKKGASKKGAARKGGASRSTAKRR